MIRFIDTIFSLYTLGLIVYSLLSWLRSSQTDRARTWLAKFYEPPLAKIRASVRPVNIGGSLVDLSQMVFLGGLIILKALILQIMPRGW